ncbi:OmpA family protein [Pelagibius sp.]|uniref:OmpA family protein n=1 Tax=Pelagibius sp. TaxID=1931238 RepID=UPI0026101BDF|nr:OmpA family protein [Pelagibius sp.]
MIFMRVLAFGVLTIAVSGCVAGYNVDRMRTAEATGTPFTTALTAEYRDLTEFEADEMVDWHSADLYARKGLMAAEGSEVQPEAVGDWRIPESMVPEFSDGRARLVSLLDASARTKAPEDAAIAQTRFDCWLEQQEEGHQLDHIARCRDEFYAALDRLDGAMAEAPPPAAPAPTPPPAPVAPQTFVLFFDFDSDVITPAGATVIDEAIAAAGSGGFSEFSVTGHADRAGSEDYNLDLSLRRADAVRDALTGRGFDLDGIFVAGRGEAEPAVPTADGVREQANRRVEIIPQ